VDLASTPASAPPSGATRRPFTVVAAAVAMVLIGCLGVANAAFWVVVGAHTRDLTFTAVALVVPLVLTAAHAGLAVPVLRRRRWARIATWVSGGLLLSCCGLGGLAFVSLDAAFTEGGADPTPWRSVYIDAYFVSNVVLLAAVITLLALPPSNRYFNARLRRP
jgi:hypothetical protein